MSEDSKEDIYEEEGMEEAVESDAINDVEEGFMQGYEDENLAKCVTCKRVLINEEYTIEREIDGNLMRFCSERCAENYKEDED